MNSEGMIQIAGDTIFQSRIRYFMYKAALAVMTESGDTVNHENRFSLAKRILRGEGSVEQFSISTVTNATIAQEGNISTPPEHGIPDGDIEFVVNSVFGILAS